MSATFIKVTINGQLSYFPVSAITKVVVNDATAEPQILLTLQSGAHLLHGAEATAALAVLEQLSAATPTGASARQT